MLGDSPNCGMGRSIRLRVQEQAPKSRGEADFVMKALRPPSTKEQHEALTTASPMSQKPAVLELLPEGGRPRWLHHQVLIQRLGALFYCFVALIPHDYELGARKMK